MSQNDLAADCHVNQASSDIRQAYTRPALTIYGSVRELTGGASGTNGDGALAGGPIKKQGSDIALKENIVRVGDHPAGYGLFLFDYKPEFRDEFGLGRQFGVIANEVEAIVPEAVSFGSDGYRRVNYDLLGITRH